MKATSILSMFEATAYILLGIYYIKNKDISKATLYFC